MSQEAEAAKKADGAAPAPVDVDAPAPAPAEETRKRKEDEESQAPPKEDDGSKTRKHRRTHRRERGGGDDAEARNFVQLLMGAMGGGGGGGIVRQVESPEKKQEREVMTLLKAATKNSVSLERRAEILRRTLAYAETVRPAGWDGLDSRIAELQQAVKTSNAILLATSTAALGKVILEAEPTWPVIKPQYNSHRWSVKVLRQMAHQKAYLLAVAQQ